ncbi:MAG: hypothetical protein K1000chlam3_01285 [Chlamydiae bacterium]|nr:hypothetical protein [Chlamydiota bacterium]
MAMSIVEGGNISFSKNENGLFVEMTTENLSIISTQPSDISNYTRLYGDPEVMQHLCEGNIRSPELVAERLNRAVNRWKENNPYNVFSVFKRSTREFLGVIVLSQKEAGVAELSGIGHKESWNLGLATEAATMMTGSYALRLKKEGYLVDEKPLCEIVATAKPENSGSWKVSEKIGMIRDEKLVKEYGSDRYFYRMTV